MLVAAGEWAAGLLNNSSAAGVHVLTLDGSMS